MTFSIKSRGCLRILTFMVALAMDLDMAMSDYTDTSTILPVEPPGSGLQYGAGNVVQYVHFSEKVHYNEAREVCRQIGGDLAKIETEEKIIWIVSLKPDADHVLGIIWQALTENVDGSLVWVTDCSRANASLLAISDTWSENQRCFRIRTDSNNYQWDRRSCKDNNEFLCEVYEETNTTMFDNVNPNVTASDIAEENCTVIATTTTNQAIGITTPSMTATTSSTASISSHQSTTSSMNVTTNSTASASSPPVTVIATFSSPITGVTTTSTDATPTISTPPTVTTTTSTHPTSTSTTSNPAPVFTTGSTDPTTTSSNPATVVTSTSTDPTSTSTLSNPTGGVTTTSTYPTSTSIISHTAASTDPAYSSTMSNPATGFTTASTYPTSTISNPTTDTDTTTTSTDQTSTSSAPNTATVLTQTSTDPAPTTSNPATVITTTTTEPATTSSNLVIPTYPMNPTTTKVASATPQPAIISSTSSTNYTTNTGVICKEVINLTEQEVRDMATEIAQNLSVDIKKTSFYRRRLTSAEDNRLSAIMIGFSGIVLVLVPFGAVVFNDGFTILRGIRNYNSIFKVEKRKQKK